MAHKVFQNYDERDFERCNFGLVEEIESLKHRAYPYWYRVKVGRHLGVHKPEDGICNWVARCLTDEKRYIQKCLGPALNLGRGRVSFKIATERAVDWFREIEANGHAKLAKPTGKVDSVNLCPIGSVYSVGHALKDYTEWTKLARSEGGHYNNLVLINHHLIPCLAHVPLERFTAKNLKDLAIHVLETPPKLGFADYRSKIEPQSLSPSEVRKRKRTFNSLVTILRMAFRHAWDSGYIDSERPWKCLKRISVIHSPRTIFLTRAECARLIEYCTPALKNLVLAALYSGCRVGELGRLTVEDVGQIGFGVRVAAFKRSPARFVFLPDEGMAFFLKCCEGKDARDPVFLTDMGKIWTKQHTRLFRRAVALARLPRKLVFHGLRHTYASDLVRSGVPLDMVARQLGHSNTRTVTDTYGHFAEHHREFLVRRCFSPLSEDNVRRSVFMKRELDDLWRSVQVNNWRDYASVPLQTTTPQRSVVATSAEVLEVFSKLNG